MANGHQRAAFSLVNEGVVFPHEEQSGLVLGKEVSVLLRGGRPSKDLHRHEQIQLVLTFGKSLVEVTWRDENQVRTERLVGRQFCFVPPQVPHACRWTGDSDLIILFLDPAALAAIFQEPVNQVLIGDFRALCRPDPLLWPLAETLRNETATVTVANTSSLALNLAARILRSRQKPAEISEPPVTRLPQSAIDKVAAYIDSHLKEVLTVELLARQVGLSSAHFARLFKNTEGTTPSQYIAKRRVDKALQLLATGEFRVAEVACEVGFYDQSHLDRHCRKFFGQPPKLLIKSALKVS